MLIEKINIKDKAIFSLQAEKKINEDNLNSKNTDLQIKLEEKSILNKELEEKLEKFEKDIKELVKIYQLKLLLNFYFTKK
jgi:hypothetical protein